MWRPVDGATCEKLVISRVKSVMELYLLLVAFLLVNAPNCHLSLVLASVVQGDEVNCNSNPHKRSLCLGGVAKQR